jgi:DNA-binding HxlR family transcriptional regulator
MNLNSKDELALVFEDNRIECLFKTFSRKRSLLVLSHLQKHTKLRYKELSKKLGNVSPSNLSSLLKQLAKEGWINRDVYGEIPPVSTEYSLTRKGNKLLDVIIPLCNLIIEEKDTNFTKQN